jgi:hypothetical protein
VIESQEWSLRGDQKCSAGGQGCHRYTSALMLDESVRPCETGIEHSREVWVTLASNVTRSKATAGRGIFGVQSAPQVVAGYRYDEASHF